MDERHLGPALRLLRRHRRLVQRELAERAGVTVAMVSAYERGRRLPSVRTLLLLLAALGADFGSLHKAIEHIER